MQFISLSSFLYFEEMLGVSKEGYRLEGWYKSKKFKGKPYDDDTEPHGVLWNKIIGPKNLTLYAKWVKAE